MPAECSSQTRILTPASQWRHPGEQSPSGCQRSSSRSPGPGQGCQQGRGSHGGRRMFVEVTDKQAPACTHSLTQCRLRLDGEWPVKGQLGTMALIFLRSRSSGFVQQLQFLSGQPPGQGTKLLEGPRPNKSLELLLWFLFGLNSWLVVTVELRVTD